MKLISKEREDLKNFLISNTQEQFRLKIFWKVLSDEITSGIFTFIL